MPSDRKTESKTSDQAPEKDPERARAPTFPRHSLRQALRVAQSIWENNQGQPFDTIDLAKSLDKTPTSSGFQTILSSSLRYGLTEGNYKSARIALTSLGSAIVAPTEGSDSRLSVRRSLLNPELFSRLLPRLDRKVIPKDDILRNTLIKEFGVPKDDVDVCLRVLRENVRELDLSQDLKGSTYFQLDRIVPVSTLVVEQPGTAELAGQSAVESVPENLSQSPPQGVAVPPPPTLNRVFIAHGQNKAIIEQVKELLTFGKFTPVVAEEHETTSRPVPEKVLEEMRSCFAGVLHIEAEQELLDTAGKVHHVLNENVLVEIGAAMALYSSRFILLVQHGVQVPSNLQGLYRCEYSGDKLDYDATMKLLKAFSEFRS